MKIDFSDTRLRKFLTTEHLNCIKKCTQKKEASALGRGLAHKFGGIYTAKLNSQSNIN